MGVARHRLDGIADGFVVMTDHENPDCFLVMGRVKDRPEARGRMSLADNALWHLEPHPGYYIESVYRTDWPDLKDDQDVHRYRMRFRIKEL